MRVFLVAGVAAAVLAFGAGCSDDNGTAGAGASAAPAATSAAASPSAAAKDAACDQIKALQLQYLDKTIATLQKLSAATQKGDTAGSAAALKEGQQLAGEWAGKLEPLAGQVADPELKTAVTQFVGQLKKYSKGDANLAQIQQSGPALTTALVKACP